MKDEITELKTQADVIPAAAENEGNELPRRQFVGNLVGVIGTTAAIGAIGLTAQAQEQTQANQVKSKILSRIQKQLNEDPDGGMHYVKGDYSKYGSYVKGPAPIVPIVE
jgi:hypothetical protein